MDFSMTQEQRQIRDQVSEFVDEEIRPRVKEVVGAASGICGVASAPARPDSPKNRPPDRPAARTVPQPGETPWLRG